MHERLKEHPRIAEMPISGLDRAEGGNVPNGASVDQMFVFSTERLASDGGVIRVEAHRRSTAHVTGWRSPSRPHRGERDLTEHG